MADTMKIIKDYSPKLGEQDMSADKTNWNTLQKDISCVIANLT